MRRFIDYFDQIMEERTDKEMKSPSLKLFELLYSYGNIGVAEDHQITCNPSDRVRESLQGDYIPLEVDPHKPTEFMKDDLNSEDPIFSVTARTYYHWKGGANPNRQTIKEIADTLHIPEEMLIIGPIAYKVKLLINKNYTDLVYLCDQIGITKEELLEGLDDKNDTIVDNTAKFAEYFQVPEQWLKTFDNPDGRGEAKHFYYTKNPNESETGEERRLRKRMELFLVNPFGIIIKSILGTVFYKGTKKEEMKNIKIAADILEQFEFDTETVDTDMGTIIDILQKEKYVAIVALEGKVFVLREKEKTGRMDLAFRIIDQLQLKTLPTPDPIIP